MLVVLIEQPDSTGFIADWIGKNRIVFHLGVSSGFMTSKNDAGDDVFVSFVGFRPQLIAVIIVPEIPSTP